MLFTIRNYSYSKLQVFNEISVCVCVCVHACVRACVHVRTRVCDNPVPTLHVSDIRMNMELRTTVKWCSLRQTTPPDPCGW